MSMPMNMSLPNMAEAMGIPSAKVNGLSPEVKALTKSDLITLGKWGGNSADIPDNLSLKDVNSIKTLFGSKLGDGGESIQSDDVNCCCCPCCCASAVMKSVDEVRNVNYVVA